MQTITSNAANFLERSNALRYLEGDPICDPSRAKAYIAKYGKPGTLDKSSWTGGDKIQEYKYDVVGQGKVGLDESLESGIYKIVVL